MKIAIIVGTRPEIIKMSPLIRFCQNKKLDYYIIHTGQHYSYELDRVFFEELELPLPKYNLDVGSGNHGEQTAKILTKVEQILLKDKPNVVLVQGDTNTVLSGALAATKLNIKVGHIEAGLRSYDRSMPEEINRIVTDHISDYLFCPTENSRNIALKENIEGDKIFVTGNTIVDAVFQNKELSYTKSSILNNLNLKKRHYFLITLHRQGNVDNKATLELTLKTFELLKDKFDVEIIFPIHPRTKKMIETFNLKIPKNVRTIKPVGFLDFLNLESNAKLILTDSGGIQEEACILKIPCVTLRENTERPETIEVGANVLGGMNQELISNSVKKMLKSQKKWKNPFGEGNATERIMEIITNEI